MQPIELTASPIYERDTHQNGILRLESSTKHGAQVPYTRTRVRTASRGDQDIATSSRSEISPASYANKGRG
jgi:hypothetical protein